MEKADRQLRRQVKRKLRQSEETITCYSVNIKLLLWILVICAALLLARVLFERFLPEPELFYPAEEYPKEDYRYIDIELLSWEVAYKGSFGYYLVADEEHYIYLVQLTAPAFSDLSEVYDYTFSETSKPVIRRLTGVPKEIPEKLYEVALDGFCAFTGLEADIESFRDYVGGYYLDCTAVPHDTVKLFLNIALYFAVCALFLPVCFQMGVRMAEKRKNKGVSMSDMERANQQLSAAVLCPPFPVLLLNDYLIVMEKGIVVMPYLEMVRMRLYNYGKRRVFEIGSTNKSSIQLVIKEQEVCRLKPIIERALLQNPKLFYEGAPKPEEVFCQQPQADETEDAFSVLH